MLLAVATLLNLSAKDAASGGLISKRSALRLIVLQDGSHLIDGPFLALGQNADTTVIVSANQSMRTDRIVNADELEFRIRLPIERHINVAWKDLPPRTVVEFDKVTFGMRPDLHIR